MATTKSNINNLELSSDFSENIATDNNINLASASEIINNFKNVSYKIDSYGNLISYDTEAWVGEDNDNNAKDEVSPIKTSSENVGTLDISLTNKVNLTDKTNIQVSLVDSYYNLHDIYVYFRNDYHEKIDLPEGKYKVNLVDALGANVKLKADAEEFTIVNGETTSLILDSQNIDKKLLNTEIMSTKSYIDENKGKRSNFLLIMLVWALILSAIAFVVIKLIKKHFKNKE